MAMTAKKREKFYDEQIAPALARLAKKCTDNGLSMLAVVEFDTNDAGESGYGKTMWLADRASESFRWFDLFVRVNANFERYCLAFIRNCVAKKIPHSSIYLERLGIHPDPEKREHPEPDAAPKGKITRMESVLSDGGMSAMITVRSNDAE